MMHILGMDVCSNSVAIVRGDGQVFASRSNGEGSLPMKAIEDLAKQASLALKDILDVAITRSRRDTAGHFSNSQLRNAKTYRVQHHDAQIGRSYLCSKVVHAAILSVEAPGDLESTVLANGNGRIIRRFRQTNYPQSLVQLRRAVATHIGIRNDVNGGQFHALAKQGAPIHTQDVRWLVRPARDTFRLDSSKKMASLWGPRHEHGQPFGRKQFDIAASVELVLDEIIVHMAERLHKHAGGPNLVLTGDYFFSHALKQKLLERCGFQNIVSNRQTIAAGAAMHVRHRVLGIPRTYASTAEFGSEARIGQTPTWNAFNSSMELSQ